jgi:mono/diheme cytochrome c family protein
VRRIVLGFLVLTAVLVAVLGLRGQRSTRPPIQIFNDMDDQPRYHTQGSSRFFADGRSMRTPLVGTVAFGGADYFSDAGSPRQNPDFLAADATYYRGKQGGAWVPRAPVKFDLPLLLRGQQRYNVHCAACHGATGAGNGITTQYGLVGVASYHDDRLRAMPDGEIFNTITNGKGVMMAYGHQISPADRWAIVAYVRALQRSQLAALDDVPEPFRTELER